MHQSKIVFLDVRINEIKVFMLMHILLFIKVKNRYTNYIRKYYLSNMKAPVKQSDESNDVKNL